MMLANRLMMGGGGYTTGAVNFDGTNDFMSLGADPTGTSDVKTGTISFWIKRTGGEGTFQQISDNGNGRFYFSVSPGGTNKIMIKGFDIGGGAVLELRSVTDVMIADGWRHIMASWDLASAVSHFYLDGTSDKNEVTNVNTAIDYTGGNFRIGADFTGGAKLDADMADIWWTTSYLDLSNAANRALFITAAGKPADLDHGSPLMTHRHVKGAAATDFAVNAFGSGGGPMTITGTLTEAATSPSD